MLRYDLTRYYGFLPDGLSSQEYVRQRRWPFCPVHIRIADCLQFFTEKHLPKHVVWGYKGEKNDSCFVLGGYGDDAAFRPHEGRFLTRNVEVGVLEKMLLLLPANNGHGLLYTCKAQAGEPFEIRPENLLGMKLALKQKVLIEALARPRRVDPQIVSVLLSGGDAHP